MITTLSDEDAGRLMRMAKYPVEPKKAWNFPDKGQKIEIELKSRDDSERFILRAEKSRYNIEKVNYHTRARRGVMLARLDLNPTGRHLNPDGTWVIGPHLHQYLEKYGDRFAVPVPVDVFPNVHDRADCWDRFLRFCSVKQKPNVRFNLFS